MHFASIFYILSTSDTHEHGASMDVSVVIPAYNEENRLDDVLSQTLLYIPAKRIFVIDDGSVDATREIAVKRRVRIHSHPRNSGKGVALRTGFQLAGETGADVIVTLDGDGQHSPHAIPLLVERLQKNDCDLVIGTRSFSMGTMPFDRIVSNRLSSLIVSAISGRWIPDSQCGLRAIRAKRLSDLKLTTRHYDTETEIILRAARQRWKIGFCPIALVYQKDDGSNINRLSDTARFCKLCLRVLLTSDGEKYD